MNQVVTFTGLETKTGSNDSGGWTLYLFKDAGGNKFQTFDDDLGRLGQKSIGTPIDLGYELEERNLPAKGDRPATTVTNKVIKSLRGTAGGTVDSIQDNSVTAVGPVQQIGPGPGQAPPDSFTQDRPIRSHETNRSDGLGHAVAFAGEGIAAPDLFALADAFTRYIETGSAVEPEGSEDSVKF